MSTTTMTPMERVLTALSHKEPDRVPLFLLLTMHGAKELGMSIKDYFSKAEHVAEGQVLMQKKYSNDCYYSFFYAPIETEAFGAEVIYCEDGPPNSGLPLIQNVNKIRELTAPDVYETPVLQKVLQATRLLKKEAKGEIPIIGVAMSPFSLPVMQLGFEKYYELMYFQKELFDQLMKVNMEFCVQWSNAQLEAGATAICYFDPVSSTTMIPRERYLESGYKVAMQTIGQINGPTATHFASGDCLPIADLVAQTGTAVVGVSSKENLHTLKTAFRNKLSVLGNLNGIEMCRWTENETKENVKAAIESAAAGGGFILSDNHGEIPFQVKEETLLTIAETVKKFGGYPL